MQNHYIFVVPTFEEQTDICSVIHHTSTEFIKKDTVILYNPSSINQATFFTSATTKKIIPQNTITTYEPRLFIPLRRIRIVQKINHILNWLWLQHTLHKKYSQTHTIILWITKPEFSYFARFCFGFVRIWFDSTDFFHHHSAQTNQTIHNATKYLLKKADTVTCISAAIAQTYISLYQRKIHVIPQGFAYNLFATLQKKKQNLKNKNITIGYIGNISPRINLSLLLDLVQSCPQYTFHLVGPMTNVAYVPKKNFSTVFHQLLLLPNIIWTQQVSQDKIPHYIQEWDICMIPYDISQVFNAYSYPMKIFEYFYLQKPVLSTPIIELVSRYSNLIYFGNSHVEWKKNIEAIITQGWPENLKKMQRQEAINNSWQKKTSAIYEVL